MGEGTLRVDLAVQEPIEGVGGAALGVSSCGAEQVYVCGEWSSGACSSAQFPVWVLGLEVDSCLCVHAIWLLLCMQEPSLVCCMKPLCISLGFVFPKRGGSSFEHPALPRLFSASFMQFPFCLPSYPGCWLRDIPKELEGRDTGFFLFGSGREGARCFGEARGSSRNRVPATVSA